MRIVSLLASATEMVTELGCLDQIVGRSHECDFPPSVQLIPVVSTVQIDVNTSSAQIDAQIKQHAQGRKQGQDKALQALSVYAIKTDLLRELQPDVIITQTQCEVCAVNQNDVVLALQEITGLKPEIVSLSPYRLNDVWEDMLRVGKALGRLGQAEDLVKGYQGRLAKLREKTTEISQHSKPRVTVLEWLDPLMGTGNWTPELVACAGGENVCGESGMHAPWLSWEELEAADPDVLILAPCGFGLERTLEDVPKLQSYAGWNKLRAVRDGRVYAMDGNAYINRSGPRLVESAEILGRIIWGEQVGIKVNEQSWRPVL